MSSKKKIWLIISTSLVVIGLIMFVAAMFACDWDFSKLSSGNYETTTYVLNEEFDNISINTDTADILFATSEDETCKVVCYEHESIKYSAKVKNSTLTIDVIDNRKWYEYIGIYFDTAKITVYLPKTDYTSLFVEESTGNVEIPKGFKFEDVDISLSTGDVNFFASATKLIKIKASTGNIFCKNISAGGLDLSVSTGKVTVSNATCDGNVAIKGSTGKTNLTDTVCQNIISNGDTGDIVLKNVIAVEKFSIKRSSGDVRFDGSDAAEIFVETDTGDVTGTLLSEKIFITKTDTGNVDVPKTTAGGKCEINTDTGDINLKID